MFRTAVPVRLRRALIVGGLGLALLGALAGGAAWQWLRCDMRDYLQRVAASPTSPDERYVFACGYLWRSPNRGRIWVRLDSSGLPLGVRDGHIALDKQPGVLYLGFLTMTNSSVYCWDCAWKFLRPVVYVSDDGGRTWTFVYKFNRGPADSSGFVGLFGDPLRSRNLWAVLRNGDKILYYASGTQGQNWKSQCLEYYSIGSGGCALPERIRRFIQPLLETSAQGSQ